MIDRPNVSYLFFTLAMPLPNRSLIRPCVNHLLHQQEKRTCPPSSSSRWAQARFSCSPFVPLRSTGCEATQMLEPPFGLAVAIALGIYLVATLLRPELI